MNESLRNKGDEFLFANIEFLSNVVDEFNSDEDVLDYIRDIGVSNGWGCNMYSDESLLFCNEYDVNKKSILIYSSIDKFNKEDCEFNEYARKKLILSDNKIYTQNTVLKAKNIINVSKVISFLNKKIETDYSWELLVNEYNINVLVSSDEVCIGDLNYDVVLCFDGCYDNLLEVVQPNNLMFNIVKAIDYDTDSSKNDYILNVEVIFKNNNIDKRDKENFNAIKLSLDIIQKIKEKLNLHIKRLSNQSKISDKKYLSSIVFSCDEDDIDLIMTYIRDYSENVRGNLNDNSIGIRAELKSVSNKKESCFISEQSITEFKNIIDDMYYSLNDSDVINIAEINTEDESIIIDGVVKLNSIDNKLEVERKLNELNNKYGVEIDFLNRIPSWAIDKNDYIRSLAIKNYRKNNSKDNEVVTVANSRYINNVSNSDGCNISYIYKISNTEFNKEYVRVSDIIKNWTCVGNFLDSLISNNAKEEYLEAYEKEIAVDKDTTNNI